MIKKICIDELKTNVLKKVAYEKGKTFVELLGNITNDMLEEWFPKGSDNSNEESPDMANIIQYNISVISNDMVEVTFEFESIDDDIWNDMIKGFNKIVDFYIENGIYSEKDVCLPEEQILVRNRINSTEVEIKPQCLHQEVFSYAKINPNKIALQGWENGHRKTITYMQLLNKSLKIGNMLKQNGVKEESKVAVILPKGFEQIIAVLGILSIGATYVPIGIHQPLERVKKIFKVANIEFILTEETRTEKFKSIENIDILNVGDVVNYSALNFTDINLNYDLLAYIIFTSGTTGIPKGVMITHKAAWNTIRDVRTKFSITEKDSAMSISELDFDLSVFDIFGILESGGTLEVIDEFNKRNPLAWKEILIKEKITIWNSVPALFEMFLLGFDLIEKTGELRLILLSGDWIKKELVPMAKKIWPKSKFVSLGGATEASIWSIYYVVDRIKEEWNSIPYGIPLANQKMRIVNLHGKDSPVKVPGEIWIGGLGVAEGYLNNSELTSEKFVMYDNQKWYKTGDLGQYDKNGVIEFLGRKDYQVKLNGYRIETGEIDSAVKAEKGVGNAVTILVKNKNSKLLTTCIVPEKNKVKKVDENYERVNCDFKFQNTIEEQNFILEKFLVEYFNYKEKPVGKTDIKIEKFWLDWCTTRHIFKKNPNGYSSGERFEEVLNNKSENVILKTLINNIPLYYEIVHEIKMPLHLLEVDELLPEYISLEDSGLQYGITLCANRIRKVCEAQDKTLNVAIVDAATGMATEMFLKAVGNRLEKTKITVFEESVWYEEKVRERLKKYGNSIVHRRMPKIYIDNDLLYKFDFVLSFNAMHTYDKGAGLRVPELLLKNNGRLIFLEYEKIVPLSYVTTALINPDFIDKVQYDKKIFCSEEEWVDLLHNNGYEVTCGGNIGDSFSLYMEAMPSKGRNIIEIPEVINHLKKKLPQYMIPSNICVFTQFALTHNGKIDRKMIINSIRHDNNEGTNPLQGIETEIAEMWKQYLNINCVYREQSFFEIGGDSLLATKFVMDIKHKYCVDLGLKEFFLNPKLYEVAGKIEELNEKLGDLVEGTI